MNYGFISNSGAFDYIKADNLKEALIGQGSYLGLISDKVAHALLSDRDFRVPDCLRYINDNCYRLEDKIEKIIKFEEVIAFEDIELDKHD